MSSEYGDYLKVLIITDLQRVAKILETLYVIWPLMLLPWSSAFPPPSPLIKVVNSAIPYSKQFEEQLWKGEREGLCVVSHRFLSSSVFEKEKKFLIANVSKFLQLAVACFRLSESGGARTRTSGERRKRAGTGDSRQAFLPFCLALLFLSHHDY